MNTQQECKYSRGELHFMACKALDAQKEGGWQSFQLCMLLVMATGLSVEAIEGGIRRLAACPETI